MAINEIALNTKRAKEEAEILMRQKEEAKNIKKVKAENKIIVKSENNFFTDDILVKELLQSKGKNVIGIRVPIGSNNAMFEFAESKEECEKCLSTQSDNSNDEDTLEAENNEAQILNEPIKPEPKKRGRKPKVN